MKLKDILEFVQYSASGGENLRKVNNSKRFRQTYNYIVLYIDEGDCNEGVARYTSTKVLLADHIKEGHIWSTGRLELL